MHRVTRFGEIPPLLQIYKHIWQYIQGLFGFDKVFNSPWHNLYTFGENLIAVNGQILKTQSGHTGCA